MESSAGAELAGEHTEEATGGLLLGRRLCEEQVGLDKRPRRPMKPGDIFVRVRLDCKLHGGASDEWRWLQRADESND
jgi:hypothetical protein